MSRSLEDFIDECYDYIEKNNETNELSSGDIKLIRKFIVELKEISQGYKEKVSYGLYWSFLDQIFIFQDFLKFVSKFRAEYGQIFEERS